MLTNHDIEHIIRKNMRRELWTPFIRAIKEFSLIEEGDRIAVAISGGKDSFLLAKLFQELYRYGRRNFSVQFFCMDPGYRPEHLQQVTQLAEHLQIDLKIFSANVFDVAMNLADKPCYLCARMRRGHLYRIARELGCNKVALGHHYDDVIETVLMNVLSAGSFMTMMPKLHSSNFSGMELIRPLYYIREKEILRFCRKTDLHFLNCACRIASGEIDSNRRKVKELIIELKKQFPQVEESILASTRNVHSGAILGTIRGGNKHSFLEHYDQGISEDEER